MASAPQLLLALFRGQAAFSAQGPGPGFAALPIRFDAQFYAFGLPKDRVELRRELSQKILEYTEESTWEVVLGEYGIGAF